MRETEAFSRNFLSGKGQCSGVLKTLGTGNVNFQTHQTTKENVVIIKMWVWSLRSGRGGALDEGGAWALSPL